MNINDLKLFKSICQTGSYTRTGELFFLSQPAVTAAVNRLEEELGTMLFSRNRFHQNVTPTKTGELFLRYADRILNELEEAQAEIRQYENTKTIWFGLPPMVGAYYFTSVIPWLNEKNLFTSLKISEYGSEQLLKEMLLGNLDIGIIGSQDPDFVHEGISCARLAAYQYRVIVSKKNALASLKEVSFDNIKNLKFISMKPDFIHHSVLLNLFKSHHQKPDILLETDQLQTFKGLVSSDAGIGLLTDMAIEKNPEQFVPIQIRDKALSSFYLYLCYQEDKFLTETEKAIITLIKHSES